MRARLFLQALFVALLVTGCAGPERDPGPLAEQLLAAAADEEPETTRLMKARAARARGRLFKLQYRLKTRKSLLRKIRAAYREHPDKPVSIGDALRYTIVVSDEPPGWHTSSAAQTLRGLEAAGHRVVRVKNYWPRGDNYSGTNCVLETPKGLRWELQFQTPQSIAANKATRGDYEELRKTSTPLAVKREIFDRMTAVWADVPVPADILKPGSLHATEEIRDRARP